MVLPDVPATIFEGEAEMALVIGKRASHVKAADAMELRVRLHQLHRRLGARPAAGRASSPMKSRDTFAPIGPYLVTADEIADPHKLPIKLWVNGEVKQDFNTDDMAHKIPRCIEWVTSIHTLEPGDILATGTNHRGLSSFMDGDTVELECGGPRQAQLQGARRPEAHLVARDAAGSAGAKASTRRRRRLAGNTRPRSSGLGGAFGPPPPPPAARGELNIEPAPLPLRQGVGGRGRVQRPPPPSCRSPHRQLHDTRPDHRQLAVLVARLLLDLDQVAAVLDEACA